MADKSDVSNAEVARQLADLFDINGAADAEMIESALSTAQFQLAEKVLAEIQTTARPTAMAASVLRDLFSRLGVEVE